MKRLTFKNKLVTTSECVFPEVHSYNTLPVIPRKDNNLVIQAKSRSPITYYTVEESKKNRLVPLLLIGLAIATAIIVYKSTAPVVVPVEESVVSAPTLSDIMGVSYTSYISSMEGEEVNTLDNIDERTKKWLRIQMQRK